MRLEELFDVFTDGDWIESKDQSENGIRLIQTGNIGDGIFIEKAERAKYVSEETFQKLQCKEVFPGDILVSRLPDPVGRACIIPARSEKMITAVDCTICRLTRDDVDRQFICYFLGSTSYYNQLSQSIAGATRKRISRKNLGTVEIDLPPLNTQKKIVNKLNIASEIINQRKKEQEYLDYLIKARFVELFEDGDSPLKTVEELCSDIVDCPHTTPKYEGELKNPAIRTSEIKKGYITWDSMRYVSDEEYEERIARLRPEAGDIVYGREGTFGNAAVLPSGYKFCLGQRVMLLRPDYTKCTSEYLLHAVISDDVYRQAVGKNNASTVAHVNVKDVKQFKIPLPSFDKQNRFAEFVKRVDETKAKVSQSLNETKILFDSLMQEYFG